MKRNLQTNSKRLVHEGKPDATKARDCLISRIMDYARKPRNLQTKLVLEAFSPVGAPRSVRSKRHYRCSAGLDEWLSDRGGKPDAR